MKTDCTKQNGSQYVLVFCIQIIPHLAIAIQHSTTIYIDIVAAKLEERRGILVNLLEAVFLPILSVVCELDVTLDYYDEVNFI